MSAIGKQAKGLDGAGIANILAGQKGNIASALPSGLGSLLSSAVPGLSSFVGDASKAATSAARTTTNVARGATREAEAAGSSVMKWLIPLLLVVLAIFFLPKMCRNASDSAQAVKDKADEVVAAAGDSTKLISDATGLIKDATQNVPPSPTRPLPQQPSRNCKTSPPSWVDLKPSWPNFQRLNKKTSAMLFAR